MHEDQQNQEVSNKIVTLPNLLSLIRLCFIPIFLVLLLNGHDLPATILFAVAASTDWVDGQVARRTNQVSRLGQLLDPFVDRLLMISGVLGLFLVGRLPLWIIVFVVARDLLMLAGGSYLLSRWKVRVAVIYPGKVATTLLYIGFALVLLNWPIGTGLGLIEVSWLPGFSSAPYPLGYWSVYAGLVLALATTTYYVIKGASLMREAQREEAEALSREEH